MGNPNLADFYDLVFTGEETQEEGHIQKAIYFNSNMVADFVVSLFNELYISSLSGTALIILPELKFYLPFDISKPKINKYE